MNITMIGAGYVGLVSAACFSEFGWTVTCIDKDPSKIEHLLVRARRADLRAAPRRAAGRIVICAWGASHFRRISAPSVGDADLVFLAGRHADAAGRRPRRLELRVSGGRRACSPSQGFHGDRDQARPCRSERAARSNAASRRSGPTPTSRSAPIPNSCARARPRHRRFHASRPRACRLRQ